MSKAYPSNLSEDQFELLKDLIPAAKPGGRPRTVDRVSACQTLLTRQFEALPGT